MENDQAQYHTGRDVFAELKAGELYRTMGFKEIAMIYGDTEKSYRKTTQLINRLRHQEKEGTPFRTLQENTEKGFLRSIRGSANQKKQQLKKKNSLSLLGVT